MAIPAGPVAPRVETAIAGRSLAGTGRICCTPAIIAATYQTGLWIASLITLRGALLATGIGALIVGAGLLIERLLRLVEHTGGWGNALQLLGEVAQGVWQGITTSAGAIAPALAAVWQNVVADFYQALSSMTAGWSQWLENFGEGAQIVGRVLPGFLGAGISQVGSLATATSGASGALFAQSQLSRAAARENSALASGVITQGFDEAREAVDRLMDAINGLGEFAPEAVDDVRRATEELNDALESTGGSGAAAQQAAEGLEQIGESAIGLQDIMQQLRGSFESAFVNFVTGTKSARDALADLARDLARMAAQRAFQQLFGGMFGGGKAGGGLLAGIFGGFRAMGGPVTPSRAYVVGERGPEMFVPQVAGQIVPNHALGGAAGAATLRVMLDPGLRAELSGEMQGIAVETTRAGLGQYDRQLPARVQQIKTDPRRMR